MSSTNHHTRVGSFADGQITFVTLAAAKQGRFCTGQERRTDAVDLREGGFADGQARHSLAVRQRGRFSSGQDRATGSPVGPTQTRPPVRALAESDG
jgi:hypothetical protein